MLPETFSIEVAAKELIPLIIFVIAMIIYSLFIFKFYRFLARKDIFKLDLKKHNKSSHPIISKVLHVIFYIIEYILLFPLFVFFWFAILTVLLAFLSKSGSVENVLLISISLVAAVRITAYYKEELSKDLAKMLPFALLGILLVDASYFSIENSLTILKQIPSAGIAILYYFLFVIVLEFILRVLHTLLSPFMSEEEDSS